MSGSGAPAGRTGGPVFAFVGSRLVLRMTANGLRLPRYREMLDALGRELLDAAAIPGPVRGGAGVHPAFGLEADLTLPDGFRADGLRVAYHALPETDFRSAGTARQRVEWYRTHRFCSACSTPTAPDERHEAMVCPSCGQMHFPRVAPAVIVLVQREDRALLARSAHFADGVYSTLAGFVEPGESLEECVHREILEEVGVRVANLRYFGSQPHPFPNSLMVGFVADWADGEIRIDPTEIQDAAWFSPDALPVLPHPMSIARALIEDFVTRTR